MRSFHLGEWLIVPELNRIERDGEILDVQPKLMMVLEELARVPGAVVTRDDLHQSIWPDVVVTEDALNRAITKLRHLLGDDPRDPRFIETIAKKGYRLVAEVRTSAARGTTESGYVRMTINAAHALGYTAEIRTSGPPRDAQTRIMIVNGTSVLVEPDDATIKLRTQSYWAALPYWLTPVALVLSVLFLYGNGMRTGLAVAIAFTVTLAVCFASIAVRSRALSSARAALRALASMLERVI